MKGDKLDKKIAASIKKQLEDPAVPYEIGAWENFQKKRNKGRKKSILFWTSAIAAGLALIFIVGNTLDNMMPHEEPKEVLSAGSGDKSVNTHSDLDSPELLEENTPVKDVKRENQSASRNLASSSKTTADQAEKNTSIRREGQVALDQTQIDKEKKASTEILATEGTAITQNSLDENLNHSQKEGELPVKNQEVQSNLALAPKAQEKGQAEVSNNHEFIAESSFPEIAKSGTKVNIGMGLTPGFGATQAENSSTSASSIGLGMQVDVALPGKFVIGSGLALNYLNQVSENQSFTNAYGRAYPQTDKIDVKQMQIEIPVFVKYPLTTNNSISLQAGFSNLYAIDQSAGQQTISNAPVPTFSADASGKSTFSIQNTTIQESKSLETHDGKFYPFATLNLGVNLRVLETKGANYVIMPFYNYQMREISGYGQTYGLFGASFKVNFGTDK